MSLRSLSDLYSLAEAGRTSALLDHIAATQHDARDRHELLSFALIAAAEADQLDTACALLDAGASVNGATERPWIRPLWKAAKRGHLEMVRLLLDRGADVRATDNDGMTALDYARRYSRTSVAKLLRAEAEAQRTR